MEIRQEIRDIYFEGWRKDYFGGRDLSAIISGSGFIYQSEHEICRDEFNKLLQMWEFANECKEQLSLERHLQYRGR